MKKTLCLQEINIVVGGTSCSCKKSPSDPFAYNLGLPGWYYKYSEYYQVSSRAACISQCCRTDQAHKWIYGDGTYQSLKESGSCACTIL